MFDNTSDKPKSSKGLISFFDEEQLSKWEQNFKNKAVTNENQCSLNEVPDFFPKELFLNKFNDPSEINELKMNTFRRMNNETNQAVPNFSIGNIDLFRG